LEALRILQVTNRIPWPLNDGGNIATYNVSRYLHRAGHHVTLASLNTLKHRQDPSVLKEVDAVHALDLDTTVTPWGLLKGLFSAQPYNVMRFWSQEFADLLRKLLAKESFDIVQLEGSYMSLYIPVIRSGSKTPIVLRSHNVEFKIWERLAANTSNPLKRFYLKNLAGKIKRFELGHLADCDAVIPIADQDEAFYRTHGFRGPLRTINGGVDLVAFAPKAGIHANQRVAFLGSLEWQPNVQGLLWFLEKVWPDLRRLHPSLELHVAGKNPSEGLRQLKVAGMVFHGEVPDAVVFMESCHFFISPLLAGGGMRLKLVEAMANGKCIVSTPIGAEGIACTNGKEIFLAEHPGEWVAVFDLLLGNPALSEGAAREAVALAQARYGWEAIVGEFVEFYREVVR
jgi:polysaccharide biosynthesis protein PslH